MPSPAGRVPPGGGAMTGTSPTKILLVDDIEENLIALEALLRTTGCEIVRARSGAEALEVLLAQHDFALALIDVNMPEMDGFQLAELMRGTQRTREIPIIFVTAAYEPHREFQGYDAGGVDFLVKPFEPKIMLGKVATFIELHDSKRRLATQLAALEQVSAQLRDSLRLHETFVAALNHDLRSPVSTISLASSILEEQVETPTQRTLVASLRSSSARMGALLDQLYDVARARLGEGIPLDRAAGDLAAIVATVLDGAELRRGTATLACEVIGDTTGVWDLARLGRVVENLISNAILHGAGGRIDIRLDGRDPARVRLAVKNAGVIPEEMLPQIFEPFRRGVERRDKSGLGLGLYIVREIASAHGGEVRVESRGELGTTTFEVELPREPA
jgi:two-component system, sensor histidine kinase and response regulator